MPHHTHRLASLLLALLLLASGCTAAPTPDSAAVPTVSPLPAADNNGDLVYSNDSATVADLPAAPIPPPPTVTDPPAPTTAPPPTAAPVPTSTPVISPTVSSSVLNISSQALALLPEYASDLDEAAAWNRYVITATLLPDTRTLQGEMLLEVGNQGNTPYQALYFRLYPNHPDFAGGSLQVDEGVLVDGQPVALSSTQEGVLLRVDLPQPLVPGEQAVVEMRFTTTTPRNASGWAYGAFNQEAGVWALASFYPILAARFGETWDLREVSSMGDLVVSETALYDVTIDTPPDWTLVTTGTRIDQMPLDHGPRRERFVSGPQRDFFLAALNGLAQASIMVDGTRVVSYYQPDNPDTGQRSLDIAEQSLRVFNARFGRYPLGEMEVIQAGLTKFLGVEYPGVMLIEQSLYDRPGRLLDTTVTHEVGHQWWYSLVGNDVQGEPWLDEGLTSYAQVLYYEGLGNSAAAEGELEEFRRAYATIRGTARDGAVGGPAGSFEGTYFTLVYAKGALFFHAMRQQMGEEAFTRFLQDYYATYRYDEATGEDMLATAQQACGCDLQSLYDRWINQPGAVDIP